MMKVALQVSHHLVSKWVQNDNIFLIVFFYKLHGEI